MEIRFDGKRALVTGAGKGIGRELVKFLAGCGAEVVAVSRSQADLDSLKSETPCTIIQADLTNPDEAKQAAEAAGDIDLLVNNAGISRLAPFLDLSVEAFDETMAVNLRAAFIISQIVARGMVGRGKGGAIVNVSSLASSAAIPEHAAYCASKSGLDHLTRVMALELGPHQIRVNCVNPTVILTPMGEKVWGDPAKGDPMKAKIPLGRFGYPIHVAQAVAYLLSDQADMITGITMPVDGGYLTA